MADTERSGPRQKAAPVTTETSISGQHDKTTPAQRWAAVWLAAPHTEPCPTCAAGWALIGGEA